MIRITNNLRLRLDQQSKDMEKISISISDIKSTIDQLQNIIELTRLDNDKLNKKFELIKLESIVEEGEITEDLMIEM
jgi:hypothetical protein